MIGIGFDSVLVIREGNRYVPFNTENLKIFGNIDFITVENKKLQTNTLFEAKLCINHDQIRIQL